MKPLHRDRSRKRARRRARRRFTAPTAALLAGLMSVAAVAAWTLTPTANAQTSPSGDLAYNVDDLDFIYDQIIVAERHAAGEDLADILPNLTERLGLRTVDGSFNSLIPGQETFGQADLEFPDDTERVFPDAQAGTTYKEEANVTDSTPRLISRLIVNQSTDNPAAVFAGDQNEDTEVIDPDITGVPQILIPNVAVDEGLSAPTNAFLTFFGQFFDHGLDLINKGGSGTVFIPLAADDPLFAPGAFMVMSRATRDAGPDGIIDTEDDVLRPINATTPHVDQQQTYASHASAQVLLRHYEERDGALQDTGKLLNGFGDDGVLDNADDGGLATWDTVQAQAAEKLGIDLDDMDGHNLPLIVADVYGNFIPGPDRGLPMIMTGGGAVEGDTSAPVDATAADRIDHSFFLDVAHTANPVDSSGAPRPPDNNSKINDRTDLLGTQTIRGIRKPGAAGRYDDEYLGVHFACGDGRCNENIALTSVHHIFHAEHNRLSYVAKRVLLDAENLDRLNNWLDTPLEELPDWDGLAFPVNSASQTHQTATEEAVDDLDLDWNGKRIFQAAKFGTEMQYNRIVFDEFAPTLAGLKDDFEGFHTEVNPTITTEFSQSVYRFGHSMLTETVDRYLPDFTMVGGEPQLGLFEAFLNPLALYQYDDTTGSSTLTPEEGVGAVLRGITRTRGNEIDEFVTGALQNNLVGLPLDLGAINIARGRDVGNPPLNTARKMFFEATGDFRLQPYKHWVDYLDNLRHEPSLVNFIAAYGTHPSVAGADEIQGTADDAGLTAAARREAACAIVGSLTGDATTYCTTLAFAGGPVVSPADSEDFLYSTGDWENVDGEIVTGLEDVDFWNGGLAEERMPFGGYLGSTHNFVFENQMERLQNGDRFYYVSRTAGTNLFAELESNSFTALAMRNTDLGEEGAGTLALNIFSLPNHILEVDQSEQFGADGTPTTADPEGDSELIDLVIRDADKLTTDIFVPDPSKVVQYTGGDHVAVGGTVGDDTIIGGIGDDALWGRSGDDRIEGGDGADLIEGGAGDDIITDLSGPDVIEGGDGNDAIHSGNEEDVIFGDAGSDFIVNSSEFGEIFGGEGNDFIFDGIHLGIVHAGAGDDWMENLGGGEELFTGDNGLLVLTFDTPVKGHDVGIAYGGNHDWDMENGDDVIVDGPGFDISTSGFGFDWFSFQNSELGVFVDTENNPTFQRAWGSNSIVGNRYDEAEGISGSAHADIIHGHSEPPIPGHELVNFDLIEGIDDLVPPALRTVQLNDPLTGEAQLGWAGGEILLGGAGSDLIMGKGFDDIIDGDAALEVMLLTPDPEVRLGALGTAVLEARAAAKAAAAKAEDDANAAQAALAAEQLAAAAATFSEVAAAPASGAVVVDDQPAADPADAGLGLGELDDSCEIVGGGDLVAAAALADAAGSVAGANAAALMAIAEESAAAAAAAQEALGEAEAALHEDDDRILVPGMRDLMQAVFAGAINPGEIEIHRQLVDGDAGDDDTDSVVYDGRKARFDIDMSRPDGFIEIRDRFEQPGDDGHDGTDLVRNVERLIFSDEVMVLDTVPPINSVATGQPTISGVEELFGSLTASMASVSDADNAGAISGEILYTWEFLDDPDTQVYLPLTNAAGEIVTGETIELTPDIDLVSELLQEGGNARIRVSAVFTDDEGVLEIVRSDGVLVRQTGFLTLDRVQYRPANSRWRIRGETSEVGATMTIFLGEDITGTGTVIGTVQADALGAFETRIRNSPVVPGGETLVTVVSPAGRTATLDINVQ